MDCSTRSCSVAMIFFRERWLGGQTGVHHSVACGRAAPWHGRLTCCMTVLSKTRNNQTPIIHTLSRVAKLVREWTLEKEEPMLEDLWWRRRQGAGGRPRLVGAPEPPRSLLVLQHCEKRRGRRCGGRPRGHRSI
jgi:hypothetical protein